MKISKKIKWLPRYSDTMENDEHGRWARVAYAGKFETGGFFRKKVCYWEIAWINKLEHDNKVHFTVIYRFPTSAKILFKDLKEAQIAVEKTFEWFIKMCVSS